VNRRSLTPSTGVADSGEVHATRRHGGGARRESADRVVLRGKDGELSGWALNVSRGGVRVILETQVELGDEFEVAIVGGREGTDKARRCRVVWVQEEHDGVIAGVAYLDAEGEPEPPRFP
jgi:hypothetical protein